MIGLEIEIQAIDGSELAQRQLAAPIRHALGLAELPPRVGIVVLDGVSYYMVDLPFSWFSEHRDQIDGAQAIAAGIAGCVASETGAGVLPVVPAGASACETVGALPTSRILALYAALLRFSGLSEDDDTPKMDG